VGPDFNVFTCNQCLCPGYGFEPTLTQTTQLIKMPNSHLGQRETEREWEIQWEGSRGWWWWWWWWQAV